MLTNKDIYPALFLAGGCFLTVIAQFIPAVSAVYPLIWLAFILYYCTKCRDSIYFGRISLTILGLFVIFGIYCAVCFVISGELGYIAGIFQVLAKSLLMYMVGLVAFRAVGTDYCCWRLVIIFYGIGTAIYSLWAIVNYFPGFNAWLSSLEYIFSSKNSLGQICGAGSLCFVILATPMDKIGARCACYVSAIAFWVVAMLFQCRTAAMAVVIGIVFLLILRKEKKVIVALMAFSLLALFLSHDFQSFVSHAFLIDKYSAGGDYSSGRLAFWADAFQTFKGDEMCGIGSFYVDNLYLNVLVNVGIIGFIFVIGLWSIRAFVNLLRSRQTNGASPQWLLELVSALTIFYLIESALEGLPPLGPGTCSFMFWILCGCLDAAYATEEMGELYE